MRTTAARSATGSCPHVIRGEFYDFPDLRWAEPDIDHAAEYLRRLSSDPDWRTRIGRRAAEDAARIFSLEAYGAVMNELVGRPSPH